MQDTMEVFKEKLSRTGIAVRYQRDNSNQMKGIIRLESAAGADGPVETLVLSQLIENGWKKKRLIEVEQSRINLKDVMGAFGSESSMSGLNEAMKDKAIVLLAATRSKRNRRVKLSPLRFSIDDDTLSLARTEIMSFLCSRRDIANGVLTNFLPTEGVAMVGSTITFFSENFTEDVVEGTLTKIKFILQVTDQIFEIGKWAGVAAPVFAVFASVVSRFETVQGLKSDFIDLLERLSKVERNLPDERRLKSDMLGLAEDFFFMSGLRTHFASKDFQGNLNRVMVRMDRAVLGQILQRTVTNGQRLEAMDGKVGTIHTILCQTPPNATEREFDWMNVKSVLPQTRSTVGRKDELSDIRERIEKSGTITSLIGVAGCGKSHLAREAADQWFRDAPEREHRIVLFASVANEESCVADLSRIMKTTLGLESALQENGKAIPTNELSSRIHKRLAEAPPNVEVLWILDNAAVSADGPKQLNEWFGPDEDRSWSNLRVVLTSQSNAYSGQTSVGYIEMVPIDPLPPNVSLALLTETSPRLLEQEDEEKAATELVTEYLHNLPVAILAVAPLAKRWTFRGYLRRLREKKVKAGVDSVKNVLQDALAEARRDPSLSRALDVAAFVSSSNMPLLLLGNEELVDQLCTLNLLQVVGDERYSMHGLIQAAAQIDRSPSDAIVALNKALETFDHEAPDTWPAGTTMIPHTEALRRVATAEYVLSKLSSEDTKSYAWLMDKCGSVYMRVLCKLESSRDLHKESLRLKRTLYANDNAHIAETLYHLGLVYDFLSDYLKAKDYFEQALAMERAVHGKTGNHENIARLLNCLGCVFATLGDDDQAKDYYEQALKMYRALYGATANHANIATLLGNLGTHYLSPGSNEQAKGLFEESLAVMRAVYGAKTPHQDIGWILRNLGRVHRRLGEYEQALKYHEEALVMMRAVYGPTTNHIDVAGALYDLGEVYLFRHEYELAKDYLKQALDMYRIVYGSTANHSNVALTLKMLGGTFEDLGQLEVAKDYFEQALTMFRAVHGATSNHFEIAYMLEYVGTVCRKLGQFEVAKDHYEQALSVFRIVFGGDESNLVIQSCLKSLQELSHIVTS